MDALVSMMKHFTFLCSLVKMLCLAKMLHKLCTAFIYLATLSSFSDFFVQPLQLEVNETAFELTSLLTLE